ncbi:A33 protein, partial [Indicator maculatus]|nr:A33 protein [Indicator maculatus]
AGMASRSQDRSLREELTCAICYELFREPVMLDCMHHFCKACIQGYWESCTRVPSCPQCRREFPSRAFRTHYLLAGLVEKVRRCGSAEHRHKMQVSGCCPGWGQSLRRDLLVGFGGFFLPLQPCKLSLCPVLHAESHGYVWDAEISGACKQSNRPSHPVHLLVCCSCQTNLLPFPSAQKLSGELKFKIRAEFGHLHQILEEEERAVLAELGEKEEQLLAQLHEDVRQLEEGMLVLQKDMEHIEQTLSKVEEVSLLEVSRTGRLCLQLCELQTITANSFCSSLQVESLDIRYVSGMKGADCLSRSLSLSLTGTTQGRHLISTPAPLTFDPESAHPNLVFSRDLTAVTERDRAQPVPSSPRRFQQCVNVLGSQTFASGQHYWEVWVGSKTKWDLGVAAEAVDRAAKVKLCPENGYWTLRLRNRTEYWATTTPWLRLAPRRPPRKVGVFLDCQEGTVAFFDAEDMSHLFTFHQVSAERYCPFFSTCFSDGKDNVEPMRLCHLNL